MNDAAADGPLRVVRLDKDRLTLGSSNSNDIVLDDVNVSRFHAVVQASGEDLELRDLDSRCGTRLDGRPIKRALVRSGAEIGIGPFRLRFDGSAFEGHDERGAITLEAVGVGVRAEGKQILRRASLVVAPGELVALIGESGSGKTTLLRALAGVSRPTEGTVSLNGDPVTARLTDTGYVPQDEIVHRLLTVKEALGYAARLRLPPDAEDAVVRRTIDRVLVEVGLEAAAQTRIGHLSGGQRKRVGVASELLNRPSLLFLDEPTTGLDPRLETQMMQLFRILAEPGRRAVVLVTHATGSLNLCDKLAVLGRGGELAFYGAPREARRFFQCDSYEGIYQALEERAASEWRERFEESRGDVSGRTTQSEPEAPQPGVTGSPRAKQRGGRQAAILAGRYAKLFSRDERNLAILFGQVPVIALAIVFLFKMGLFDRPTFASPHATGRPRDAVQLLFVLITTVIWFGALDGSREIVKERGVTTREAAIGVGWGPYLLSKVLLLSAVAVTQTVLLAVIVLAAHPLGGGLSVYLSVMGLLVLTSLAAVAMGLAISASVNSEDQATSFIPLALIPQLLFAGAIVSVAHMTGVVAALSYAVFGRWALAGAGTAVDLNGRIAADPNFARLNEYGHSFFDLPAARAAFILLAFIAGFLLLSRVIVGRRMR